MSSAHRAMSLAPRSATWALVISLTFFDSIFGADKIKHFFLSAFIQSAAYSVTRAAGANDRSALAAAWVVTATAGIGREVYDARAKGRFSVPDLAWGAMGAAAATEMLRRAR